MTSSSGSRKFPVEVHYGGVFVENPFEYSCGEVKFLVNVDFTSMKFFDLMEFLKNKTRTAFANLYFCIPGKELKLGLKHIKCDADIQTFVHYGMKSMRKVSLYLDHYEDDISAFLAEDEQAVTESEEQSDSDDDCWSDDDDEIASLDHLSEGEDELVEFRKKRTKHSIPKKDVNSDRNRTMADEHESFLNDLCESIRREYYGKKEMSVEDYDEQTDGVNSDIDGEGRQEEADMPRHNPRTHWKLMKPVLGERYDSPVQLKECLTNYAVANGFKITFERNDCNKLLARCRKGGNDGDQYCPWRLWATWMRKEPSFQVKSLVDEHTCLRNFKACSLVTYKWIGKKFGSIIRQNPSIKLEELQAAVMKKYKFQVTLNQCSRARGWAVNEYEQGMKEHYDKLWSYAEEIRRTNPSSTVKLNVEVTPAGKVYFQSCYICLQGLKDGWKSGCRRVIGLGGCFLKTECKGELLSAVSKDGNNQIFPVAWAVVSIQNKDNWLWFLQILKNDLDLANGDGLTLLSDGHKGLSEALKEVIPYAEHRHCARQIYANFKEKFSGVQLWNLFWAASKATYPQIFEEVMNAIRDVNPEAYDYLIKKDPNTWSRAFFRTGRGCDSVENGMGECFNSLIHEATKKPIITLLEAIRLIVFERMIMIRSKSENWNDVICPAIRKKLDHAKDLQRDCQVIHCSGNLFEVRHGGNGFIVDESRNTCSCGGWQLSGLPCAHALAAILFVNKTPESYVPEWFTARVFNEAYNKHLMPINNMKMWPQTTYTNPLPPKPVQTPRRPKLKRRRDVIEVSFTGSGQVRREGTSMTCKNCFQVGHNKRTCKSNITESTPRTSSQRGRGRGRRGRPPKTTTGGRGLTGCLEEFDDPITVDAMLEQNPGAPLLTWSTDEDMPPLLYQAADMDYTQQQQADMEVFESQPTPPADDIKADVAHITQDR